MLEVAHKFKIISDTDMNTDTTRASIMFMISIYNNATGIESDIYVVDMAANNVCYHKCVCLCI